VFNSTLTDLDERYSEELGPRQWNDFFVTHAAYGYICDRYGLEQNAIIGMDANEQPSSSVIANLVDQMIMEGIYTIYLNPVFSDQYANMLEQEVEFETGFDVAVLELYIMTGPMDEMDYLQQMEVNLDHLCEGLGACV
jgi:zinc transport system substrate-binding protein